jgi:hypothetical protein
MSRPNTSSSALTEGYKEGPQAFSELPIIPCIERVSYLAEECVSRFRVEAQEIQWTEARQWPRSLLLYTHLADREPLPPGSQDA